MRILLNAQATNERKKRFEKKRKREFYKVKTDEKKKPLITVVTALQPNWRRRRKMECVDWSSEI